MKKAWITVGISASGKSTWADKLVSEAYRALDNITLPDAIWNISRDEQRRNILIEKNLQPITEKGVRWSAWNWKWEDSVNQRVTREIACAVSNGAGIIISDTNLNPKWRNNLIKDLENEGYEVVIVDFPITFEEACKRDAARINGVGVSVIAKQWDQWIDYLREKGEFPQKYEETPGLEWVTLCDIDGTLAHMNGRGPFEWNRVGEDVVDEAVRAMVSDIETLVLLSGRDGVCEAETKEWLKENSINYMDLYMREKGDMRKDTIIKRQLFDKYIRGKYNVNCVIDDRPSVCRMWRDLGLKVFQVGNPHIDF